MMATARRRASPAQVGRRRVKITGSHTRGNKKKEDLSAIRPRPRRIVRERSKDEVLDNRRRSPLVRVVFIGNTTWWLP
jgi:hypothetical protein